MHYTSLGATIGALAGLATASDLVPRSQPCSFDVGKQWNDDTLFNGYVWTPNNAWAVMLTNIY